ncbi:MAG TPA: MBL fold metallo-hydrolase [Nitrososphaerales archaeon]|nr:MBL fold metallo-hydrolase [Nitrososphaerales archaeon]
MIQQVTHSVWVETGVVACNLGMINTGDGLVLVDTPMGPADAVRWRKQVDKKGEVRFLINTEEHPDHCRGDYFFHGILVAHEKTKEKLSKLTAAEVRRAVKSSDPASLHLVENYRVRLPDIAFNGSLEIHQGDLTLQLFETPGHVPGGISVYVPEERIVFTGDVVFHRWKSWLHESDPQLWLESIEKIRKLDADVVVPGHGPLCTREYLDEQADIVRSWVDVVRDALKGGMSEAEAVSKVKCPDPYPIQPGVPLSAQDVDRRTVAHLYALEKARSRTT